MVDLPGQVPSTITSVEAPRSQLSPGEIESPYFSLGRGLDKIGEGLETASVKLAEQAGFKAVTRDAAGNIQIEKAPIIGEAANAYARAVKMGALAESEGAYERKDIELRQQYRDNPDGYARAAQAYRVQAQADMTRDAGPEVGVTLGQAIEQTTTRTYRGLLNEKERLDLERADRSIKARIAGAEDDATALARGGADLNTPALQQAVHTVQTLRNELVNNPRLAYPKEQADYENQHFIGEIGANRFLYHIDQVYKDGPDADTRARNALNAAKDILTNPDYKLSEAQREGYYHRAVGEIRANEAQRKQDISEWRMAESELRSATLLGVPLDPQRVDQIYKGYQNLGATREAMGLLAWEARAPLGAAFGRMPIPDQVNQLRFPYGAGPVSMDRAKEAIAQIESGGNYGAVTDSRTRLGRALGKYQVMEGELQGQLQEAGLPAMTPQQFLQNPQAQEQLFERVFGGLMGKYGNFNDAASVWFSGKPAAEAGRRHDVLGTTVPQYLQTTNAVLARNISRETGVSPSVTLAYQQNMARHLQSETTQAWGEMWKEWREKGTRPSDESLFSLADAARASGNDQLLDTMKAATAIMDGVQQAAQGPLAGQEARIAELRQRAAGGLAAPGDTEFRAELEKRYQQITKGLAEDAPATVAANFPERFKPLPALDLSNDQALMAGLAERGRRAVFAADNWQTRTPSALGTGDLAAVQGALENGSAADKARIFGALVQAIPDRQALNATLAKIGEKGGAGAVAMWAGGLMQQAPDAAQSILRGQDALKADKRFAPEEGANKTDYDAKLDRIMPAATFSLEGRTAIGGSYETVKGAIKAAYADLSARANDTSGRLNDARLQQAVDNVTGGVLTHNGGTFIAPTRGMSQLDFERVMAGMRDSDLAGATTLSGQPITARYLATQAKLESAGDGRYRMVLGNDAMRPIYAISKPEMGPPQPFILDLRNRTMGNVLPWAPENQVP